MGWYRVKPKTDGGVRVGCGEVGSDDWNRQQTTDLWKKFNKSNVTGMDNRQRICERRQSPDNVNNEEVGPRVHVHVCV